MSRWLVGILAVVAAGAGLLVTAANRWGAASPGTCRDTVSNVLASCLAPQSPPWALALGSALPALVLAVAAVVVRGRTAPDRH